MAEDTLDAAISTHNLKAGPCKTVGLFLEGGKDWSPTLYIRLVQDYGLESEVSTIPLESISSSLYALYVSSETKACESICRRHDSLVLVLGGSEGCTQSIAGKSYL